MEKYLLFITNIIVVLFLGTSFEFDVPNIIYWQLPYHFICNTIQISGESKITISRHEPKIK